MDNKSEENCRATDCQENYEQGVGSANGQGESGEL
jgi:hypothetical protein